MGTAREPVAGSGDWPAWTARVAKWRCSSDIYDSLVRFRGAVSGSIGFELVAGAGRLFRRILEPNGKARILEDPGRFRSFKIVCAYRIRFSGATRTGLICRHIHMHMVEIAAARDRKS